MGGTSNDTKDKGQVKKLPSRLKGRLGPSKSLRKPSVGSSQEDALAHEAVDTITPITAPLPAADADAEAAAEPYDHSHKHKSKKRKKSKKSGKRRHKRRHSDHG